MKKFIAVITLLIFCFPLNSAAAEKYITISPQPYSSHVLGEDLTIYAETNYPYVALGLYYPNKGSYNILFSDIITASALKQGYTISTPTVSTKSPEGEWLLVLQYGETRSDLKINMVSEAVFDRNVKIAEYENNTLTKLTTQKVRGIQIRDNILSFITEDGTTVKFFFWDNLAPSNSGVGRMYIASYKDGYLISAKTYQGELSELGNHFTLQISETKKIKFFYWDNNLSPIQ